MLALNQNFSILDFALIIPGAMGSALTGYVMCKKTSWGFTRFWWIIIKGISTITLILIGTTCLGPWQMKMVELSGQPGNALTANESYGMTRIFFTDAGFLQVIMLACIVTISALKPWGKRIARQNKATMAKNRIEIVA